MAHDVQFSKRWWYTAVLIMFIAETQSTKLNYQKPEFDRNPDYDGNYIGNNDVYQGKENEYDDKEQYKTKVKRQSTDDNKPPADYENVQYNPSVKQQSTDQFGLSPNYENEPFQPQVKPQSTGDFGQPSEYEDEPFKTEMKRQTTDDSGPLQDFNTRDQGGYDPEPKNNELYDGNYLKTNQPDGDADMNPNAADEQDGNEQYRRTRNAKKKVKHKEKKQKKKKQEKRKPKKKKQKKREKSAVSHQQVTYGPDTDVTTQTPQTMGPQPRKSIDFFNLPENVEARRNQEEINGYRDGHLDKGKGIVEPPATEYDDQGQQPVNNREGSQLNGYNTIDGSNPIHEVSMNNNNRGIESQPNRTIGGHGADRNSTSDVSTDLGVVPDETSSLTSTKNDEGNIENAMNLNATAAHTRKVKKTKGKSSKNPKKSKVKTKNENKNKSSKKNNRSKTGNTNNLNDTASQTEKEPKNKKKLTKNGSSGKVDLNRKDQKDTKVQTDKANKKIDKSSKKVDSARVDNPMNQNTTVVQTKRKKKHKNKSSKKGGSTKDRKKENLKNTTVQAQRGNKTNKKSPKVDELRKTGNVMNANATVGQTLTEMKKGNNSSNEGGREKKGLNGNNPKNESVQKESGNTKKTKASQKNNKANTQNVTHPGKSGKTKKKNGKTAKKGKMGQTGIGKQKARKRKKGKSSITYTTETGKNKNGKPPRKNKGAKTVTGQKKMHKLSEKKVLVKDEVGRKKIVNSAKQNDTRINTKRKKKNGNPSKKNKRGKTKAGKKNKGKSSTIYNAVKTEKKKEDQQKDDTAKPKKVKKRGKSSKKQKKAKTKKGKKKTGISKKTKGKPSKRGDTEHIEKGKKKARSSKTEQNVITGSGKKIKGKSPKKNSKAKMRGKKRKGKHSNKKHGMTGGRKNMNNLAHKKKIKKKGSKSSKKGKRKKKHSKVPKKENQANTVDTLNEQAGEKNTGKSSKGGKEIVALHRVNPFSKLVQNNSSTQAEQIKMESTTNVNGTTGPEKKKTEKSSAKDDRLDKTNKNNNGTDEIKNLTNNTTLSDTNSIRMKIKDYINNTSNGEVLRTINHKDNETRLKNNTENKGMPKELDQRMGGLNTTGTIKTLKVHSNNTHISQNSTDVTNPLRNLSIPTNLINTTASLIQHTEKNAEKKVEKQILQVKNSQFKAEQKLIDTKNAVVKKIDEAKAHIETDEQLQERTTLSPTALKLQSEKEHLLQNVKSIMNVHLSPTIVSPNATGTRNTSINATIDELNTLKQNLLNRLTEYNITSAPTGNTTTSGTTSSMSSLVSLVQQNQSIHSIKNISINVNANQTNTQSTTKMPRLVKTNFIMTQHSNKTGNTTIEINSILIKNKKPEQNKTVTYSQTVHVAANGNWSTGNFTDINFSNNTGGNDDMEKGVNKTLPLNAKVQINVNQVKPKDNHELSTHLSTKNTSNKGVAVIPLDDNEIPPAGQKVDGQGMIIIVIIVLQGITIGLVVGVIVTSRKSNSSLSAAHPALLEEGVNQGSPNKNKQTEQPNEKVNILQNKDPGNDNNDKTDPKNDKEDDSVKDDKTEPDCTDDAHSVAEN